MADFKRFPHLQGATQFPGTENVNVYKYKNEFDYDRWTDSRARYRVVNVPWCGDYDNVVDFETIEARDAYLDSLDGAYLDSTMVQVKNDSAIKLPLPIANAQCFNYLIADLPVPTSEGEPIENATLPAIRRYLYFLDDASQASASVTYFTMRLDVWQTYIYGMRFDYAMLERGHAPMAAMDAGEFLANPIENTAYLMADDVSFGDEPKVAATQKAIELDSGDMYICFATWAYAGGNWGSVDDYTNGTPSYVSFQTQGAPAPAILALDAESDLFIRFMRDVDDKAPSFKACIQGIFFLQKSLAVERFDVSFLGYNLHVLGATEIKRDVFNLNASLFDYPEPYNHIAKLYTYPYAALKLSDADGHSYTVRIEDTTGTIQLAASASLVMPDLSIDGRILGIGGDPFAVTMTNNGNRSFTFGGAAQDYIFEWGIPTFTIAQSSAAEADWTGNYERRQARLAADNALASSLASNRTAQTNANNGASNTTQNNAVSVAANTNLTANANSTALDGMGASNHFLSAQLGEDNKMTTASYEAQQDALSVASNNNSASAAASAIGTLGTAAAAAATATGIGAPIGIGIGAITGLTTAAIGWSCANNSNAVSQSNSENVYNATIIGNTNKTANSIEYNGDSALIQNDSRTEQNTIQNNSMTSIANNNASLIRTNAANTKTTADANANRAHDTSYAAVQAAYNHASTRPPIVYGSRSGAHPVTRPRALIAQIVKQPKGAIACAGDAFLRYGYMLHQQWQIEKLQVMKHFTYWKLEEVWCSGAADVLEGAQSAIKDIMTAGVTVWSDPNEIGKVSIHDNY